MSSFFLTVLSATVARSMAQLSMAQPTDCQPAIIGLSTALGISLTTAAAAVICQFKDRLCCTRGDRKLVYDTACPYCEQKQPRDCMREHLTDCEEHNKFWSPRLQASHRQSSHRQASHRQSSQAQVSRNQVSRSQVSALNVQRPARTSLRVIAPTKPPSLSVPLAVPLSVPLSVPLAVPFTEPTV